MTFQGYSPETVDFLWGIRMNNNREWFLTHRQQYIDTLYAPTKALGELIFEPFRAKPGMLLHVSRIYRDARMHPPAPYKESLWVSIRRECAWWGENPCLFFDIKPEGISYGFGLWQPRPAAMERFRAEITARPEEFPALADAARQAAGVPVTADCYKRPKPTDDPALAPYFGWKGNVCCIRTEPFSPEAFSPAMGERVRELLVQLTPLYDYFLPLCTESGA